MIILKEDKYNSIIKELFIFYSKKIHNYIGETFKYRFTYTESMALKNFIDSLKKEKQYLLNIDWLFDYFNTQFCHWDFVKKSKNQEDFIIQLHWIIGKKALQRFNDKNRTTYFYHTSFYPKYKIKKEDLIEDLIDKNLAEDKEDERKIEKILSLQEERWKKRKLNTIEGFGLCINFTTLYNFDSPNCKECKYKKACKSLLKQNYPKLYRRRLVENFKNTKN